MPAVEMLGITKAFGGLTANNNVNLKVLKGEIHAIVGENGAGKSTLMKILYGMYTPDSGEIKLNGREIQINSPAAAIKCGIGMVHQHFMLVGPLSVHENIILGAEKTGTAGTLDLDKSGKIIEGLIKDFNIKVDLSASIDSLPVGAQQKVEILKILYRNADILILDEPTAVLTPQETDDLFNTLKKLKAEGKTIIIITHKLGEVLSISDNVTVLREGRSVAELETKKTNHNELANLIVGYEIRFEENEGNPPGKKKILEVKNIYVLNDREFESIRNISFDVYEGEIFGIAGVEGNGQHELIEAITLQRSLLKGEIILNSNNKNIAHIPADRHKEGIVMDFDIAGNMILGRQREKQFGSGMKLNFARINKFAKELVGAYDIRPENINVKISGLSGGNQQKTVAARELSKGAELIVVSHPTRGLDIKASEFVQHAILNERNKSKAIILISSDLSELLRLSDRIAVIYNGEINAILNPAEANERELGLYMTGVKMSKGIN